MRSARKLTRMVVATLGVLAFMSAPAWAGQGYEDVTGHFGEPGPGPGQFKEPTSVAVNDATGDVYVLDSGNDRIEWFNSTGAGFKGEFNGSGDDLAVEGKAAPTGKFLNPGDIAIDNDPASLSHGDVYIADVGHGVVDEFSETGEYERQLTGGRCENEAEAPPCASGKLVPFKGLLDVAVDPSGNLYVFEAEAEIASSNNNYGVLYEFDDEGGLVEKFPTNEDSIDPGFAVDSNGNVYVIHGEDTVNKEVVEFEKGTGSRIATLPGYKGSFGSLAIIASTNDLLVDDGSSIELFKSPLSAGISPLLTFPSTGLSESAGIAVNGARGEGTIYATQRGADDVDIFESGKPEAPKIVGESAATVNGPGEDQFAATINPENRTTKYYFEYSTSKEQVEKGEGTQVPGEAEIPAEFGGKEVASPAVGLNPYETVYYRVVAENELSNGTPAIGEVESYTKLPLVGGEKISNLTSTSALLEATINPAFVTPLRYAFEYATSAKLLEEGKGTLVPNPFARLSEEANEPLPVSTEIAGLQPGQTYFYRIVAENGISETKTNANKGEPVRGKIKEFKPYAAPVSTTGAAQNITGTAATLSGTVDPEGTEAKYYFEYINNEAYEKAEKGDAQEKANPYAEGETTTPIAVAAGDVPQATSEIPVSGLLPGETYDYALVVINKFELREVGKSNTFTTGPATPPVVTTGAVSNISQNSATLSGTVATSGLQTEYGFEIGTTPGNYGPVTGLGSIGGATTEAVRLTLGELQPGTTYYYRVTASSVDGTEHGEPVSFTTSGFPTLIAPPASPPLISSPSIAFPKEEKSSGTTVKTLTSKEKLANALKQCKRDKSKSKRQACERAAKKKYPVATKKKKKKKKKGGNK